MSAQDDREDQLLELFQREADRAVRYWAHYFRDADMGHDSAPHMATFTADPRMLDARP